MFFKTVLSILGVALFLSASPLYGADTEDAILGVWTTQEKDAKIEIFTCGAWYCGKVIWLAEPDFPASDDKGMANQPKVDRNNPDPKLKDRPLLGLVIMEGFSYVGDSRWKGGRFYNPENGKVYRGNLKLAAHNRLKVRGFLGISLFGQTETWTR